MIAPVILASDKTRLTRFQGDKQAWPVYLTLGNIEKETRRKGSEHGTILIGYIPVEKLECFKESTRPVHQYRLFHHCVRHILAPMVEAGKQGVDMVCADGNLRRVFPILAAYVADHPEQCLVACCMENRCPKCLVSMENLGERIFAPLRNPAKTLQLIDRVSKGLKPPAFTEQGIRFVDPFWKDLPHCDIFSCFTPDILHQLHKGVFNDHVSEWAMSAASAKRPEFDRRFKAMPSHPSLRHFKSGISHVSQWTGTERKEMEKVFLGTLLNVSSEPIIHAVRHLLNFIYLAHYEMHTDETLRQLEQSWEKFTAAKRIFLNKGIRKNFEIPKIHSMQHYVEMIRSHGTADGYNTEASERLHIDYAKVAYESSNKRDYIPQMKEWLMRRESIVIFSLYLDWVAQNEDLATTPPESEPNPDHRIETRNTATPTNSLQYSIAKTPPHPTTTIGSIINDYGAADFSPALRSFLTSQSLLPADFESINVPFPTFKRFTIHIPPIRHATSRRTDDVIRATIARKSPNSRQQKTPSFSDTVLAKNGLLADGEALQAQKLDGMCPAQPQANIHRSSGLQAGQVKVIFALPAEYGPFKEPLAYIEWFTPLHQRDSPSGMYKITPSTRQHRRNASIIPISSIARSCHLIPLFGRAIDWSWRQDNVLKKCNTFYVNPYLRHIDFVLFNDI